VGDRPPGSTGNKAKFPLVVESIDLVHHAVNVIAQRIATSADILIESKTAVDSGDDFAFRAHLEAPDLELIQNGTVAVRYNATVNQPNRVNVDVEWPLGG